MLGLQRLFQEDGFLEGFFSFLAMPATPPNKSLDSFSCCLPFDDSGSFFYSLPRLEEQYPSLRRLPFSLRVLLENLLRFEDGTSVHRDDIASFEAWEKDRRIEREIAYRPTRVLLQDFTGVPAIVDLAAMRDAMAEWGGDAQRINPLIPVDLVIDHSVIVDHFAARDAFRLNVKREYERNRERYQFLRWGQGSFANFRVVPPGTGICHQVNLEYLAQSVWQSEQDGVRWVYPDTVVGADSHTTMINALGVLGWGVGGIEAEAAMLGQPLSLNVPEVTGFEMTGRLSEGTTATDLVLRVVEMLREKGVVGKFVEFFGTGLSSLSLADRATIANMAPEYGATCGIFPIDNETLRYLRLTGRNEEVVARVERYAKMQGFWRNDLAPPLFTDTLCLDLGSVDAALAGPKRPQDRIALSQASRSFKKSLEEFAPKASQADEKKWGAEEWEPREWGHGAVVIAAITSCTNTSNPNVLLAAGLLAEAAVAKGLTVPKWVKTSFAPGSQVVTDYLARAGLTEPLETLGFALVGYGCTTCIGNSGPLLEEVTQRVRDEDLYVCSVLSGNRNFEGRVNPLVRANYLCSPPLVVAYALAGSKRVDLLTQPLGKDTEGQDVFLRDIWPRDALIAEKLKMALTPEMFRERYSDVFRGAESWNALEAEPSTLYRWQAGSSYVRRPSFFEGLARERETVLDIRDARVLALLGDSITTDHISPAGSFSEDSAAGVYLSEQQIAKRDFNSYGARRGNHEVMMRGTFANVRIKNRLADGKEGGWSKHMPSGEIMSIYDVAMRYGREGVETVIIAGKAYGTGSSRDWAAKGTRLLGVRAVMASSFERIHRSNLVGMGVLPLEFLDGVSAESLNIDGSETFDLSGLEDLTPRGETECTLKRDGKQQALRLRVRIDTADELAYYRHGGILPYVLRGLAKGYDNKVAA